MSRPTKDQFSRYGCWRPLVLDQTWFGDQKFFCTAGEKPHGAATFIAPAVSARTLGEGVVDAVLHQKPVGADAGLAGIPIFRGERAP